MKELTVIQMSVIVLVTQVIFMYLRAINVKAIASDKMWPAIWTQLVIGATFMTGMTVATNAAMEGNLLPIIAYLVGGVIGTWIAMRKKREHKNKKYD